MDVRVVGVLEDALAVGMGPISTVPEIAAHLVWTSDATGLGEPHGTGAGGRAS